MGGRYRELLVLKILIRSVKQVDDTKSRSCGNVFTGNKIAGKVVQTVIQLEQVESILQCSQDSSSLLKAWLSGNLLCVVWVSK